MDNSPQVEADILFTSIFMYFTLLFSCVVSPSALHRVVTWDLLLAVRSTLRPGGLQALPVAEEGRRRELYTVIGSFQVGCQPIWKMRLICWKTDCREPKNTTVPKGKVTAVL